MGNEIDLKNYNIRTDLVIDMIDINNTNKDININKESINDIDIVDIEIKNNKNKLNKKRGKYITISFKDITDSNNNKKVEEILIKEIKKLLLYLKIKENDKCLVIGLGNIDSTPDSLGPKVINNIIVTRYLYEIENINIDPRYRNVSAFIPGVSGITGIESSDIIKGIIDKIKPDFLIVIDSLASSSIDRINKTIQLSTAGINPGSGVYNNRGELSIDTLGINVLAIGIPTVIEASILVSDTFKYIFKNISYNKDNYNKNKLVPINKINYIKHEDKLSSKEKKELLGVIGTLSEYDIRKLIYEVLTPINYNMMVTPKEVDYFIKKSSTLIAHAVNKSLHKKIDI